MTIRYLSTRSGLIRAGAIDTISSINTRPEDRSFHEIEYHVGTEARAPVYPDSPEWTPTIKLIEKYSRRKLRTDKQPGTIARVKASLSTEDAFSGTEWTSPSTPIVVIYGHWPRNTGVQIPKDDVAIVGTIGDLRNWIAQSKSDFHFLLNDIFLGLTPVILGLWLWINEAMSEPSAAQPPKLGSVNDSSKPPTDRNPAA